MEHHPFDLTKVQLECSHVLVVRVTPERTVPAEFVRCNDCKADVALYAVECREWRVNCPSCRYARWYGDSQQSANEARSRHWTKVNHTCAVRYTIHYDKFQVLKKYYKRRYRFRIDGRPAVVLPRVINRDDDGTIPF